MLWVCVDRKEDGDRVVIRDKRNKGQARDLVVVVVGSGALLSTQKRNRYTKKNLKAQKGRMLAQKIIHKEETSGQLTPNCKVKRPNVVPGITMTHSTMKACITRTQIAEPKATHPMERNAQCIFV